LTAINVNAGNAHYSSADGVLFNRDKTVLITCPAGKTGNYAIPRSVTAICEYAFADCSGLTGVTIPGSVTDIGIFAFLACRGLTDVTIPGSVTTVGTLAFYNCTNLTDVTIGDSVADIGIYTFASCIKLSTVTNYCSTPQSISEDVFSNTSIGAGTLRVPAGAVNAYRNASVWNKFENIVEIN
jgi:F420-0:gamma-glutamyl ligase-like protein